MSLIRDVLSRINTHVFLAVGVIATFTLILTVTAQQPRTVDADVLETAGTDQDALPGTWLTYGLTQTEQRYSQLTEIDESNVGDLGLAWSAPLVAPEGGRGGTEGTPLVWNDTIYQPMDNSIVYALDARTGEQKWMYDAQIDPVTRSHMCCGTHNKGLAISDGKIFLAANDDRLIALDATSGEELWQTTVADINEYYSLTIAPRIAGDKVVIGVTGGEYFIRGFFAAYDIDDGLLAWKFHTVPPAPGEPFEDQAQEDAAKTWTGDWAKYGGGGPVWDGLVYDPDTNLVIAGTGNAEPWPQELRGIPKSEWGHWDNLYTCSIVAVDADTGELKWYYQTVPTDSWDFDSVGGLIMADIEIEGQTHTGRRGRSESARVDPKPSSLLQAERAESEERWKRRSRRNRSGGCERKPIDCCREDDLLSTTAYKGAPFLIAYKRGLSTMAAGTGSPDRRYVNPRAAVSTSS